MQVTIVGNSAAALSALESFRERDQTASVTLVSAEPGPAYSRVLLPYYLRRRLSYDGVFIRQMDDYARLHAATEFGARVERVDPATRELRARRRAPPRLRPAAARHRVEPGAAADPRPRRSGHPHAVDPGRRHPARSAVP